MTGHLQHLAWTEYKGTKLVGGMVQVLPSKGDVIRDVREQSDQGPGIVTEEEHLVSICAIQALLH